MRSRYLLIGALALALVLSASWIGNGLAAADAQLPGSQQDPLVTRSYVEEKLKLNVVEMAPGKRLVAGAGTELILRSGNATVVDSESGGLSDVTDGVDLRKGTQVPRNHLLIVPRDDGRGITAQSEVIVLVRGDYRIE